MRSKSPTSFLRMWTSNFPAPSAENCSLLTCPRALVENQLIADMKVYFWAFGSIPVTYVSVSMSAPHLLDYWSFAVKL